MNKDLIAVFEYLEREKGIKRELIIAAIEESLLVAARKSVHEASNVAVHVNPKTADIEVHCDKEVVEKVSSSILEISLKDAKVLDPEAEVGKILRVAITPKDFGRIAAARARQVIAQKLRGAERDVIYEEYRHRLNQLISGTVKRIAGGNTVIVDLGKVSGVMPRYHYPQNERYQVGDKVIALLQEVRDTELGGAEVLLSRTSPEFVKQLLVQEVPELADGTISIETIVREPGYRTKLIVRSTDPKVDPVGACIGMRGIRVKNVVRELNEKIDVIPYSQDKMELLEQALDPVVIRNCQVTEDSERGVCVFIVVDDEEYGTAIGKRGSNARLIGELLGVRLEVQKLSDFRKIAAIERAAISQAEDPFLNEPLQSIEGVPSLIVDQLIAEGYTTPKKLLEVPVEQLAQVPGISLDLANTITSKLIEQMRKHKETENVQADSDT